MDRRREDPPARRGRRDAPLAALDRGEAQAVPAAALRQEPPRRDVRAPPARSRSDVFVATSARHTALVRRELPDLPAGRIFAEPARRNSGPRVLAAAVRFAADGDPVTAGGAVGPDGARRGGVSRSARGRRGARRPSERRASSACRRRAPRPTSATSRCEGDASSASSRSPSPRTRASSSTSGSHFWNAGIFVFRPSRLLAEARRVAADLVAGVERFVRTGAAADYEALPDISIDYAVMEKIAGVRAVPLRAGWSDVGTWRSVRELKGPSDASGNLVVSPVPVLAPGRARRRDRRRRARASWCSRSSARASCGPRSRRCGDGKAPRRRKD